MQAKACNCATPKKRRLIYDVCYRASISVMLNSFLQKEELVPSEGPPRIKVGNFG